MKPYFDQDGITLYHGDYRDVLPLLDLKAVDATITDPPYEITASGGGIGATRRVYQETEGFTDCGFDYAILDHFDNWVCFGTLRQVPELIKRAADRRWMLLTWNKPNPCPLVNGNYLPDTEYIIHAWRNGKLFGDTRDKSRFIVHRVGDKEHGEHPNEKPLTVMQKVIRTATDRGQLILDPFAGSGTTLVAAKLLGRRAIGIEREKRWCEVAASRLSQGVLFGSAGVA